MPDNAIRLCDVSYANFMTSQTLIAKYSWWDGNGMVVHSGRLRVGVPLMTSSCSFNCDNIIWTRQWYCNTVFHGHWSSL